MRTRSSCSHSATNIENDGTGVVIFSKVLLHVTHQIDTTDEGRTINPIAEGRSLSMILRIHNEYIHFLTHVKYSKMGR